MDDKLKEKIVYYSCVFALTIPLTVIYLVTFMNGNELTWLLHTIIALVSSALGIRLAVNDIPDMILNLKERKSSLSKSIQPSQDTLNGEHLPELKEQVGGFLELATEGLNRTLKAIDDIMRRDIEEEFTKECEKEGFVETIEEIDDHEKIKGFLQANGKKG